MHFCNVYSDLPNTVILKLSFRIVGKFNISHNSVEIKLLWLPVSMRIAELSDFVLDKLLTIAIAVCNKVPSNTFSIVIILWFFHPFKSTYRNVVFTVVLFTSLAKFSYMSWLKANKKKSFLSQNLFSNVGVRIF